MNGELIEVERRSQEDAVEADTGHDPVADPPRVTGSPMVSSETDGRDLRTQVERINPDLSGAPVRRSISYAVEDHPDGVRWPYTTTRVAFVDHVRREPGFMVWLLPHEVAAFHRPVDRASFKALGVPE